MSSRFDSLETDGPFTHCCACDRALLEAGMHIINKSFVGDECVFEMAMCMECREELNEQMSEESRVATFDFMHDHADFDAREKELGTDSETAAYLTHCITCNAEASTLKHFSIGGMFTGDTLVKGPFPMLMCGKCEEKLSETISDETREMRDRFLAEHFPGPPADVNIPTVTKPVMF